MNIAAFTRRPVSVRKALAVACLGFSSCWSGYTGPLSLEGVHVVPHVQSSEMRYRQKTDFSLGARVEIFLRNTSPETLVIAPTAHIRARGRTPEELLIAEEWAWHDLPSAWGGDALRLPPGAMTVWSWNVTVRRRRMAPAPPDGYITSK